MIRNKSEIMEFIRCNPGATKKETALKFGISIVTIARFRKMIQGEQPVQQLDKTRDFEKSKNLTELHQKVTKCDTFSPKETATKDLSKLVIQKDNDTKPKKTSDESVSNLLKKVKIDEFLPKIDFEPEEYLCLKSCYSDRLYKKGQVYPLDNIPESHRKYFKGFDPNNPDREPSIAEIWATVGHSIESQRNV